MRTRPPRAPAAVLIAAASLLPAVSSAQRCATPSPLLEDVQRRALEQLPAAGRPRLEVDLSDTAGRVDSNFSDAAVGYVVADVFVRRLAPLALERIGRRALAARLRALAPVVDRETAFRAEDAAEDVANTLARRAGRLRWSTPLGMAAETAVEAAALAGYAANPGTFPARRYVATIASGLGAADRLGVPAPTLGRLVEAMVLAARPVARCHGSPEANPRRVGSD